MAATDARASTVDASGLVQGTRSVDRRTRTSHGFSIFSIPAGSLAFRDLSRSPARRSDEPIWYTPGRLTSACRRPTAAASFDLVIPGLPLLGW